MATLYVATSKIVAEWAADVGLTKQVYKVGVTEEPADEIAETLSRDICAGGSDWKVLKKQEVDGLDEATAIARIASREKMVDPAYYPRIRGAQGLFRVKVGNVANNILVKRALAGEQEKIEKVKAADIAAYLLQIAQG